MSKTPQERNEHRRLEPLADREFTAEITSSEHDLVAVTEFVPGREPTAYTLDPHEPPKSHYRTRFLRCRKCGQERNDREAFPEACDGQRPHPLSEGGYSVEEPRTRRALTEDMDVRFARLGPLYTVQGESGTTYDVDIEAWTCTCPDFQKRGEELTGGCKHLRRVDLEVRTGILPDPEGRFLR